MFVIDFKNARTITSMSHVYKIYPLKEAFLFQTLRFSLFAQRLVEELIFIIAFTLKQKVKADYSLILL